MAGRPGNATSVASGGSMVSAPSRAMKRAPDVARLGVLVRNDVAPGSYDPLTIPYEFYMDSFRFGTVL